MSGNRLDALFDVWSEATGSKLRRSFQHTLMRLLATGTDPADLESALAACQPDPHGVSR